jgi:hypothetical protein
MNGATTPTASAATPAKTHLVEIAAMLAKRSAPCAYFPGVR